MIVITRAAESVAVNRTDEAVTINRAHEAVTISRADCPTIPISALQDSVEITRAQPSVMICQHDAERITIAARVGAGVASGGEAGQILEKTSGVDYDTQWVHRFYTLIFEVEYTGTETAIAGGTVDECIWRGGTIYRFRSDAINPRGYRALDAFYSTFDGTIVNGLMARRNHA